MVEFRAALQLLVPFESASARSAMQQQLVGRLLGTIGLAYADLGQTEKAIGYLDEAMRIGKETSDPQTIRLASDKLEQLRRDDQGDE